MLRKICWLENLWVDLNSLEVEQVQHIDGYARGLWIEDGAPAFPVAEITISANLAEVLKGVEMVGNDLRFRRSTNGPTVKVAEMTIGGTTAKG